MITSYGSFAQDLRNDFDAGIAVPESLPTQYENAGFTPPRNTPWCAYKLLFGSDEQIETGSVKTFRLIGILSCRILVAVESGTRRALQLADLIADRYRAVIRAGAEFRNPSIGDQTREDSWWVTSVLCPYWAERFVS